MAIWRAGHGGSMAGLTGGLQMVETHRDAAASESEPTMAQYVAVLSVVAIFVVVAVSLVSS